MDVFLSFGGPQAALVVSQGVVHRASLIVLGDIVLSIDMNTVLALQILIFKASVLKTERIGIRINLF